MVARPGASQVSWNAGELAPELHAQTGLKQFFAGAAQMRNVQPIPQGGFTLMPRTRHRGSARRGLTSIATGGALTLGPFSAAGVVWSLDLGITQDVALIALLAMSADVATSTRLLVAEIYDPGVAAWRVFSGPLALPPSATPASRTLGFPPAQPARGHLIRLRLTAAPAAPTTITIGQWAIYGEPTTGVEVSALHAFTVARAVAYMAIFTPSLADFFRDGVWCGCVGLPYGADVVDVHVIQRADTAILNHEDYPEYRILRHGEDWDFSLDESPLSGVPSVDYGGSYSPTSEVWQVNLTWLSSLSIAGQGFVVSVNGAEADLVGVVTGPDWAATCVSLKAAIEGVSGVAAGVTVTVDTGITDRALFTVTFAGANTGQNFVVSGRTPTSTDMALTTWRQVRGVPGGEPLVSTLRGYAGTANFWQDRLVRGDFRSKHTAFLPSRTGEYFDWDIKSLADSGAYLINMDAQEGEKIIHIAQSKHLVIFTSEGEYFIADRTLSRNTPPNIVRSSTIGASARVRPAEQESSLLFVNREETIVFAATYNEVAQGYQADPISLLCSHLIDGVTASALQASASANDAQRYWLARAGGGMAVGLLIRNQDVTGFVRWETDGQVRGAARDGANRVFLLVDRMIAGQLRQEFEEIEEGLLLDAAVTLAFDDPTAAITGLTMHEGAEVWALVDGYVDGPFTVTGGAIRLNTAGRSVTVGRWTPPLVETLPLVRDVGPHVVLKRPARVHTVQMDLIDTQSLAVGANGLPARDVARIRHGSTVDAPPPAFSGEAIVTGLKGFSAPGQVTLTQVRPGRLQVRNVTVQARI